MPTSVPSSVPTVRVPPTPRMAYPTPTPTYAFPPPPAPMESDAECCFHGGCSSYGTSMCHNVGTWCSQSSANCQACAGTYCSEMDWWDTQATAPSSSEPTAESQCCLVGGCGSASCIDGGAWCSGSRGNCQMCQGTFCTRTSLLTNAGARKRSFLHKLARHGEHALLQASPTFQKASQRSN